MKKIGFLFYSSFFILHFTFAQTSNISGIINIYTPVTAYSCDSVSVVSSLGFSAGDRALLIQMKGAAIDTTNTAAYGTITSYNDAGNYEFASIASVTGNTIHFAKRIFRTYTISGLVQLVRVPQYVDVNIIDTLTASPWNDSLGIGGVLAFEASGTVTLNANIDATGLGFIGGVPSINNWDACSEMSYISPMASGKGAQKGEGITPYSLIDACGRGQLANGGGGGNRVNAGGGGGGNYARGGHGGWEWSYCSMDNIGGEGGDSLIYNNTENKVFLGGGGGGGQQNNSVGTSGTAGGGIIIIKANIINGNNYFINANGHNNTILAGIDGAGGGGAGGTVLLSVANNSQSLNIQVNGGRGGTVNGGDPTCWGPGGGGAGGIVWSSSFTGITASVMGGTAGMFYNGASSCDSTTYGAVAGEDGGILADLIIQESNLGACGALPVVNFQSSDSVFCADNCVNFNNLSVNSISYQWLFPGGTPATDTTANPQNICYLTSGSYDVILIAANNSGTDTLTFNHYINVKANPPTPLITQTETTLYCSTDPSYISYQWFDSTTLIAGATDTFLVITNGGNYNVQVTNENGCKIAVGINIILGIENYINNNILSFSPNPVRDELLINGNWNSETGNKTLNIFNILGEIIYTEEVNSKEETINCKSFKSGIYFMEIVSDRRIWAGRFIKE